MLFGRSIVHWIVVAVLAVCVFFLAQWIVPLVFGLVGVHIPENIVNILALLIAVGCFYGGYNYNRAGAP